MLDEDKSFTIGYKAYKIGKKVFLLFERGDWKMPDLSVDEYNILQMAPWVRNSWSEIKVRAESERDLKLTIKELYAACRQIPQPIQIQR